METVPCTPRETDLLRRRGELSHHSEEIRARWAATPKGNYKNYLLLQYTKNEEAIRDLSALFGYAYPMMDIMVGFIINGKSILPVEMPEADLLEPIEQFALINQSQIPA